MKKTIQLFLLPYAGGSSFSFMKMIRFLNPEIEAISVEYSGRGGRKNEPFIDEYNAFLSDVVRQIRECRNDELGFAILGYSMGSVLAFDICSQKLIVDRPIHAFFCAEGSLKSNNQARKYASLSDESFKEKILQLGGLDSRILNDHEALDLYLNVIRADHKILGQYEYRNNRAECDSTIIYSTDDSTCVDMQEWIELVTGKTDFFEIGNNHFFINQEYKTVADIINRELSF
ncbi:thioesterase domain-containing protein [Mordavella massiliensis]|uniref:thioesterase II family protein n=1 Tax=Mordavella massiliensis TaxID=1871024 RepID=UPI002108C688|nr:thioesterase domain-containing protein [Mordavella massiliensis]